MRDKPILVEAVSVEVTGAQEELDEGETTARSAEEDRPQPERPHSQARVRMFTDGAWAEVDLYARAALRPGHAVDGPAIIAEDLATTVVEPGWQAVVTARGDLLLSRVLPRPARSDVGTSADPVMLEIFNNLFMSVAEQMGVRLQSTAHSVNIKERLDFSCAVFDAGGRPDRQRPAHARPPRLHGRVDQDGDQAQPAHPPRRRLRPERPVPRRHPHP